VRYCSLFLFYLGIGLTVLYSLRLFKLLYLPSNHYSGMTPSFSCSLTVKGPILWLIWLSIFQGTYFRFNCYSAPAFLGIEDKIVVCGVLILSLFLINVLVSFTSHTNTPFTNLCFTTTFLSSYTRGATMLQHTEVSAFHGGGMVYLPLLVKPFSLGSHFFIKLSLTLTFAFLIL